MKAIITKYAMTSGVRVEAGRMSDIIGSRMFRVDGKGVSDSCYHGHEFHLNKASAKKRLVAMAMNKKKSLERQLVEIMGKLETALKQIDDADMP